LEISCRPLNTITWYVNGNAVFVTVTTSTLRPATASVAGCSVPGKTAKRLKNGENVFIYFFFSRTWKLFVASFQNVKKKN
jgi:hypothetical protein